jgi:hypothetical protein
MYTIFEAYKSTYSRLEYLDYALGSYATGSVSRDLFETIDVMADEGISPITIYIFAHAFPDEIRLGTEDISVNVFREKVAAHPDTIFNFILEFPYSGSFIDDLSSLDNVCVIKTACSADEIDWLDWDHSYYTGELVDPNHEDQYAEWTSSLLEVMQQIVVDSEKWNVIKNMASYYDVPVTSMLICQAGYGALGLLPGIGLDTNYDLVNYMGWTTPSGYCSFEAPG